MLHDLESGIEWYDLALGVLVVFNKPLEAIQRADSIIATEIDRAEA